jgi:hypothetical protein
MIIDKEIVSKIPTEYVFTTGIVDIDSRYFKKKIDQGVQTSTINYTTNVYGKHTEWKFFNSDEKFCIVLFQLIDHLETLNIDLEKFSLWDAWGLKEGFGDYTKRHHHDSFYFSGVLYLDNHDQTLFFPDIKQEITPKKGRFVVFSSFLEHYTKRNMKHKEKYAISFNFKKALVGEKF